MRRATLAVLLLPLLAGGCGSARTAAPGTPASAATPWMVTYAGSPPPTPTPLLSYSSPTPFPTGFLPLTSANAAPTPTPSGSDCATITFRGGEINAATVVAGTTSAAVTWYNPGGDGLVEYRVTAISQNPVVGSQRDVGWTVLKPGSGCGMLTAPVTGLDRKTSYVFSVVAVFTKIGEDGTWSSTVARSVPIKTR